MATSSIFTNVRIEGPSKAEAFINALEKAASNVSKTVKQNAELPCGTKKNLRFFHKERKKIMSLFTVLNLGILLREYEESIVMQKIMEFDCQKKF